MKKYIAALLTALLLLCTALSAGAVGPALTTTEAYCIMDADTGLVLAQQNMNEELHPASITKVMTLGLACEKAQGNWDDIKLTVTHEDVYSLAGTDSSHIALREGEEVPLTDALYATQMASANDGANLTTTIPAATTWRRSCAGHWSSRALSRCSPAMRCTPWTPPTSSP